MWKNFQIRKRRKLRILIEILWPLALFLILALVRRRGLRDNMKACNFATRPLPSSGLFPFMRGMLCELNNSCYSLPQGNDAPYAPNQSQSTSQFNNLVQLFSDIFQFGNQATVVNSTTTIALYLKEIIAQQNSAAQITSNLTLAQYTYSNLSVFTNSLNLLANNSTLADFLLQSNPNYNYLYSNYSKKFSESNSSLEYQLFSLTVNPTVLDLLYGPDLNTDIKPKE